MTVTDSDTTRPPDSENIEDTESGCNTDDVDDDATDATERDDTPPPGDNTTTSRRTIALFSAALIAVLTVLVAWLAFRDARAHQAQAERGAFLRAAQQGALDLTTIDYQHAEADVHRILDRATGDFYDDFTKRSQPFIDVLKQTQAKTVGTVTQAGLVSENGDTAEALVAVSVQTTNAGQPEPTPREWRMRISVQKTEHTVKLSNVGFVP